MSNVGQAAFTVVGGVVGYIYGGPAGAAQGASWGYAIGSAAFPTDLPSVQGPRIEDLSLQDASYGVDIPKVYGTMRLAGNVIWAADAVEHANTTSQGGKGGGGSQESTTFTYTRSFAIGICEGEISGIRRIWRDNVLIYFVDSAGNSLISEQVPVTFHLGSETQEPDSVIEAAKGVGNAPAYRGLAYAMFTDENVTSSPKRIPQYEFEVISSGASEWDFSFNDKDDFSAAYWSGGFYWEGKQLAVIDDEWVLSTNPQGYTADDIQLHIHKIVGTSLVYSSGVSSGMAGDNIFRSVYHFPVYSSLTGYGPVIFNLVIVLVGGTTPGYKAYSFSDGTLTDLEWDVLASDWTGYGVLGYYHPIISYANGHLLFGIGAAVRSFAYATWTEGLENKSGLVNISSQGIAGWDYVNAIALRPGTNQIAVTSHASPYSWSGFSIDEVAADGTFTRLLSISSGSAGSYPLNFFRAWSNIAWHADGDKLAWGSMATGYKLVIATWDGTTFTVVFEGTNLASSGVVWLGDNLVSTDTTAKLYEINFSTWTATLLATCDTAAEGIGYPKTITTGNTTRIVSCVIPSYGANSIKLHTLVSLFSQDPVLLSSIVSDICTESDLLTSDIDVSALTSEVKGYARPRKMSGRAAIEPLQVAYQFDAAEIDNKLAFVNRGGSSVITIPEDDLAAHEYGSEDFTPFPTVRKQETELPVSVSLKYPDHNTDYLVGVQAVSRLVTSSVHEVSVETPVVLTSTEAAKLVEIIHTHAWMTRHSHSLKVGMKYAHLTPTDVITVERDSGTTHTLKILGMGRSGNGIISMETVDEDSATYTSNAVAIDGDWVAQTLEENSEISIILLNAPILSDQHNTAGIYYAIYGTAGTFRGAGLYRSTDDTEFVLMDTHNAEATVGTTTTTLADGPTTIIDQSNTVTVEILTEDATLSSVTEAQMLDGSNYALIGAAGRWEMIQFQTATLVSTATYTLSGLTRGRQGTEHNTGNHTAADTFILLNNAIRRLDLTSSGIGTSYYWRVVPFDSIVDSATSQTFTNNGENLECFSPVNIHGTRDSSDNLTITWQRRTRFGGEWKDYTGIPLNEAFQAYEVDILDGATVVRTIEVTSETASYTAAQQTTDFGSAQASLDIEIYQISDTVGRGHKGEATI